MLVCGWCNERVIPTKNLAIGWLLLWLLLGVVGVFAYLIYWTGKPGAICPLCEGDVYGRAEKDFGSVWLRLTGINVIPDSPDLEKSFAAAADARKAKARERRRQVASP